MNAPIETDVLAAADRLVDAFARFDKASYFASFRPDADFIFYNSDVTFPDRVSYERAWDEWVTDGWRVLGCRSVGGKVRMLDDDNAVFTHEVFTTLGPDEAPTNLHERETIIFSRQSSGWLAVHEHLSARPD
jgi:hypothetical protein